jgi:hypothetical protein
VCSFSTNRKTFVSHPIIRTFFSTRHIHILPAFEPV